MVGFRSDSPAAAEMLALPATASRIGSEALDVARERPDDLPPVCDPEREGRGP
jgi:hypothetical protein